MASNMIGNLAVSLTMNTAAFQKGATLAEKRAATLKTKMDGIGASIGKIGAGLALGAVAGGAAILGGLAKNAFELGSSLTEAAAKVGVTVEALQEMRFAATQNGISIETMDGSLNKMSKTLGSLQLGNKATAETFNQLGLSAKSFIGLTPTESFAKIADALKNVKDETIRSALGNQIFGRSYAELKPLVDLGAKGIAAAAAEKRKDGVISTEQAAILDDLADGWDKLKERVGVTTAQFIANQAGSQNASAGLERVAEAVAGVVKEIQVLLSYSRQIDTFFNNLEIKFQTRLRDSALTSWIPGVARQAQKEIDNLNAQNQRNSSNGGNRPGVRGGTGRVPTPRPTGGSAGGALAGTMAGAGAGAIETLNKLEAKAAGASARVAKPIKAALTEVEKAFKTLTDNAVPLLDRLFPEVKALLDYKADSNTLAAWAKAGKIDADKLTESLVRLRDSYFGVDGPVAVTQDGSFIDNITDSLPALESVATGIASKIKTTNVQIVESFGDMVRNVTSSITGLANSIKGGGILGILEGVSNLFLSLGGAGAFGKTLQGRINAPGRARGGATTSNRSYMVGERGPELFTPNRSGFVTPNNKMSQGGRAVSVQVIPSPFFNVVVDGRADGRVAAGAPGIATAAAKGVQTNLQQNNYRQIP